MNIITYITTLFILVITDSVWLFSTADIYRSKLGHLFAPSINFIPVLFFYPLYAFGLFFFVIEPILKSGSDWKHAGLYGACYGFIAYATYDLTNNATLKDWPFSITCADMLWGAALSAIVSIVVVLIFKHWN